MSDFRYWYSKNKRGRWVFYYTLDTHTWKIMEDAFEQNKHKLQSKENKK